MDAGLYREINRFAVHTAWAHPFMKLLAIYAIGLFAVLVIYSWWCARYAKNNVRAVAAAGWAAIATVVAVGINQLVIHAVKRPRPYWTLRHVEVLVAKGHDYTFPSDHATAAGAAAAGLWIIARYGPRATRRVAQIGTVLAVAIAFARVYVGAHYPGDVAAGLVLGAGITTLGWFLLGGTLTEITRFLSRRALFRPLINAGRFRR
ncbi:MAG: phosphatase PAP2 family protein [Acidobacteriota bacterium]|nr:phosphatase PAP2 family protein [Acidobacteriota bacterium]MDE3043966.1 phosphatase PAP2 family protein [Acidobacteriota bacterium]MDE3107078.1 phosphatase PAP2 family protein [Acidobacteriota bacterium]